MKKIKATFALPSEPRQKTLLEFEKSGIAFNVGTVFLEKGTRIPDQGFTQHPQHEISYIQTGKIQMINPDGSNGCLLQTGDIISIELLHPHAGEVLEDTKVIYVLIGKT